MKLTKLTTVAFVILFAATSMAQGKGKKTVNPAPKAIENKPVGASEMAPPAEEKKLTPEEKADRLTNRMEQQLLLSPSQKSKIGELNRGVAIKNDAIRKDQSITQEQKKERIESNNAQRKMMLHDMLNEQQNNRLETIEQKKAERKEARMEEKGSKPSEMKKAPEKQNAEEENEEL